MAELNAAAASRLIDLFWLTFNTVNMYGFRHPLAAKSVVRFYEAIKRDFEDVPELTIHLDGQRVFCNGQPANPNLNLARLVERMNSAGILSINFLSGIKVNERRA